jgi:hypothetical protein
MDRKKQLKKDLEEEIIKFSGKRWEKTIYYIMSKCKKTMMI